LTTNAHGVEHFKPVRKAGYVAEIFSSRWSGGLVFHYVIQREGSKEILHFGQELSEQRAREIVTEILQDQAARSSSPSA